MRVVQSVIGRAVLCGAAGALAWTIGEPLLPRNSLDPTWAARERIFVLLMVLFIGLAAGLLNGLTRGGRRNILLGAFIGGGLGMTCGLFGYAVGGLIVSNLFPPGIFQTAALNPVQIAARMMVFLPIGIGLGFGIGASMQSVRGMASGAIGGGIGAALAGLVFDPIGMAVSGFFLTVEGVQEVGTLSRAIMTVTIGLAVGLCCALVERATRSAWVRLVLGRNEGREWPIDGGQATIGRDERAQVPLFGDPNVAPLHARIVKQSGRWHLVDEGSPVGTGLNGQYVQNAPLNPGDQIMVGRHVLQFLIRGTPVPKPHEAQYAGRGYPIQQASPAPSQPLSQPQTQPQPVSEPTQAFAVPSVSAGITIKAVNGPLAGQRFPIHQPVELGRESASIPMSYDTHASRRHARLELQGDRLSLLDLGSTNGVQVNGMKVTQAMLGPGDRFQIGNTLFEVE